MDPQRPRAYGRKPRSNSASQEPGPQPLALLYQATWPGIYLIAPTMPQVTYPLLGAWRTNAGFLGSLGWSWLLPMLPLPRGLPQFAHLMAGRCWGRSSHRALWRGGPRLKLAGCGGPMPHRSWKLGPGYLCFLPAGEPLLAPASPQWAPRDWATCRTPPCLLPALPGVSL